MAAKKNLNEKQKKTKSLTPSIVKKTTAKPTKHRSVSRPTYQRMVTETLSGLDPRKGATRAKLVQQIKEKYGVDSKLVNSRLRVAVKTLLDESVITLVKGTGYSNGHFRLATKGKKETKKSKSPVRSESPSKAKKTEKTGGERGRPRSRSKSRTKTEKENRSPSSKSSAGRKRKSRSPMKTKKQNKTPAEAKRSKSHDRISNSEQKTKKKSPKTNRRKSSSPMKKSSKSTAAKSKNWKK